MSSGRVHVQGRLRRAVHKIKFFISFNARRWFLSSMASSSVRQSKLNFKSNCNGLLDCKAEDYCTIGSSMKLSRSTSFATASLSRSSMRAGSKTIRSMSDASSTSDIDQRAEEFITNFYEHIQMERQVSLQLRYCRENNSDRKSI